MAPRLLDGRRESKKILAQLQRRVRQLRPQPRLATIRVGRRPDAMLYLRLKGEAARAVGIGVEHHVLPASVTQAALIRLITALNKRKNVTGILLQLPLPSHLNTDNVVSTIAPHKDVDGFTRNSRVMPPPVAAVLRLIAMAKPKKISSVVILGRDSVFAATLARHLKFHHLSVLSPRQIASPMVKDADVIITVSGRGPRLMGRHIQRGVILVDVGIRQIKGKTTGDIDSSAQRKSKAFSPVPGGVGPLTVAFVLKNTVDLAA